MRLGFKMKLEMSKKQAKLTNTIEIVTELHQSFEMNPALHKKIVSTSTADVMPISFSSQQGHIWMSHSETTRGTNGASNKRRKLCSVLPNLEYCTPTCLVNRTVFW